MPATSLKLPIELKKRIERLVADRAMTAHAFMVEAIRRETERAERQRRFVEEAREAEAEVNRTGRVYDATEVFEYLEQKLKGRKAKRPRAKAWRRSA